MVRKTEFGFFLACYKSPPQHLEGSFEERHRRPEDHQRLSSSRTGTGGKSLDQAVKWYKRRSRRSDLFEKLHWQNQGWQTHGVDFMTN